MQTRSLSARAKLAGYIHASEALLSHSFFLSLSFPFAVFSFCFGHSVNQSDMQPAAHTQAHWNTRIINANTVDTVRYIWITLFNPHLISRAFKIALIMGAVHSHNKWMWADKWNKHHIFFGSSFANMRICFFSIYFISL